MKNFAIFVLKQFNLCRIIIYNEKISLQYEKISFTHNHNLNLFLQ